MSDWHASMEPAFLKVGRYLCEFSLMELTLDRCIANALKITDDQSEVIARIISLNSKVELLMDSIYSQTDREKTWKDEKAAICTKIAKIARDRNIVAHCVFSPEGDGIVFSRRALRKSSDVVPTSSVVWTKNDYKGKCDKIRKTREKLEALEKNLKPVKIFSYSVSNSRLTAALNRLSGVASAGTEVVFHEGPASTPDS